MSNVIIEANEIDEIKKELDKIMEEIEKVTSQAFPHLYNHKFYKSGKAEERMERILDTTNRIPGELFTLQTAADYYGKIQMLSSYYSLIQSYCFDALQQFQEQDEALKQLLEKYISEVQGWE